MNTNSRPILLLLVVLAASWLFADDPEQATEPLINEKKVLDTFREMSSKDTWSSRLLRSIFIFERETKKTDESMPEDPIESFLNYQGKTIGNIRILVLDVFGTSVKNLSRKPDYWLEKTGNALHVNTRKRIIRNQLLFHTGDKLDPLLIAESERILRNNRYIYDARIKVFKNPDGSVDLDVVVRDVWTLKAEVAMYSVDKWNVSISDENLAGLGGRLHTKVKFDPEYKDGWNWDASYRQQNLFKDNITAEVYRKVKVGSRNKGFGINREFKSSLIRWLYGTNFEWNRNEVSILRDDTDPVVEEVRYTRQDLWLGRTIPINIENEEGMANYITGAARVIRTDQTLKAAYDPEGHIQDSYMGVFSLGYLIRSFRKVSYLFRFGVTEDVPVGSKLELTTGFEDGSKNDRTYYSLYYLYSLYEQDYGYFSGELSASGFKRSSTWESRQFETSLKGISRLLYIKDYRIRQYAMLQYNVIENPIYSNQMLSISDKEGIRGLSSDKSGDKRLRLNLETNYLMPFQFLGFNFSVSVFGDFALLAPENVSISSSKVYQGYGIGLRFKNEHLVFKTIEIFLGYYPVMDSSQDWNLFSRSASYYNFSGMGFGKPEVIE